MGLKTNLCAQATCLMTALHDMRLSLLDQVQS